MKLFINSIIFLCSINSAFSTESEEPGNALENDNIGNFEELFPEKSEGRHVPTQQSSALPYHLPDFSKLFSGPTLGNFNLFGDQKQQQQDRQNQRPPQGPRPGEPLITVDLCYYLGHDVLKSHIPYNDRWNRGANPNNINPNTWINYVNEMTLEANKILNRVDEFGQERNTDFLLTWNGPWPRSDPWNKYPKNVTFDVKDASNYRCDVVVFLLFNNFDNVNDLNEGHSFSGYAEGAACEAEYGKGYAVVVDQGFQGELWVGPQVLAHHILLLLSADLTNTESRNCPNDYSLLFDQMYVGQQWRDQCVNSKLQRSQIPLRPCLHD